MEQTGPAEALLNRNTSNDRASEMALKHHQTVPGSLRTLFHGGALTGLTDGQLLERFALREVETAEAAFAALLDRHGPMVLRTCLAVLRDEHEAHDAFQATFLVLVRKAGSLWVEDSLGPWLHRVAYHAAARARLAAARRRVAEQRAAERVHERAEAHVWDDLAAAIHEEIDRLPERYRIPVVLCDLEERPYEEAARHLGCPVGTVKSRLARGRERLRQRLTRRGVADPARILATGFAATAARSALPPSLTRGTVRLGIGRAAASAAPVSRIILVKEALRAMIGRKWGSIVSTLLVFAIVSVGMGALLPKGDDRQVVAAPSAEVPNGGPGNDRDAIEGTWVRASTNGVKADDIVKMVVTKDPDQPRGGLPAGAARFVFEWRAAGGGGSRQKVLLDPTHVPNTIDFLIDQPDAPKVCPGIYRLEGDTLTICFRPVRGTRPAGFVAVKRGEILDVYRRERSDASQSTGPLARATPSTAGRVLGRDAARIDGNWIVRGAYENALALVNIEVQGRRPRVSLLPVNDPNIYRVPESRVENVSIDENSVRFQIRLVSDRNAVGSVLGVDAYIPEGEAQPKVLYGSTTVSRSRFPVELERTDLKEWVREPADATAPGSEELRRFDESKDLNKKREILEGILEKHGDRPLAPIAAWCLANVLADSHAARSEFRSAADRAIRLAARYGSEMELAAVHRIADHLVESGLLPDLALEYASRADAMLQPSDPFALQRAVLENLVAALRRTGPAEDIAVVQHRLFELKGPARAGGAQGLGPAPGGSRTIPGRRRASPPSGPGPRGGADSRAAGSAGVGGSGRILAFVHSMGGEDEFFQEIVAINPDNGTWEKLTDDGLPRWFPRASGDGKSLAYSGLEQGVFRCSIRGGDPVRITDAGGCVPLWSPDGKQILVSEPITPPPETRADYRWITWRYQADGTGRVRLPLPETGQVLDWSPDGSWLVTCNGGMDRLTLIRPDGTGARELTGSGLKLSPRFSPHGRRLSYGSARTLGDEERSLWVAETGVEDRRRIFQADHVGLGGTTCWSPDGKWIAAVLYDWKRLGHDGYEHTNSRIEILDASGKSRRPLRLPRWHIYIADWR